MSNEQATAQYRQPGQHGGSPRETEGRALLEAARRLAAAKDKPDNRKELLDTVRLNWRLWTIFQSEVNSQESPLPPEIRTNVITLCNFVDKHTVEILSDPNPDKLDILISINRNIAAGLLADPSAVMDAPAAKSDAPERLSA